MNPRILAIVPALRSYPEDTVLSIQAQEGADIWICIAAGYPSATPPNYTERLKAVILEPNMKEVKGRRVGRAINAALELYNLNEYDYLLKVDDDTKLTPDFFKENAAPGYALLGAGMAMLIKMAMFVKYTGGRFFICSTEDTYLIYQIKSTGWPCLEWRYIKPPISNRRLMWSQAELFQTGYDVAGMGVLMRPWRAVKRPVQYLGHLYGLIQRHRLPIYAQVREARRKGWMRP